jgi:hypothetical protein
MLQRGPASHDIFVDEEVVINPLIFAVECRVQAVGAQALRVEIKSSS